MRSRLLGTWLLTCIWMPGCFSDLAWVEQSIKDAGSQGASGSSGSAQVDLDALTPETNVNGDSTISPSNDVPIEPLDILSTSEVTDSLDANDTSSGDVLATDGRADAAAGCDPNEVPAEGGVFVSKRSEGGTGTAVSPYSTIAKALEHLGSSNTVYIDAGIYGESLTIEGNVTLRGGWRLNSDGKWTRLCVTNVASQVEIKSPSNIGVRIKAGTVRLQDLTVSTRDGQRLESGDGESTYGVWASGGGTLLVLTNSVVIAGKGGDGAAASGTGVGTPASCEGTTSGDNCKDGSVGAAGSKGDDGALGTFTADGYQAVLAMPGAPGAPGMNGKVGAEPSPSTSTTECVLSCGGCDTRGICAPTASGKIAADLGKCGCGGGGGGGGMPGRAGGASIGVLVASNAGLRLDHSRLAAADGGKGTNGAAGKPGLVGSEGQPGDPRLCHAGCTPSCGGDCRPSSIGTPTTVAGGERGGKGGAGGNGGSGGAGAGGPSVALVTLSGAAVIDESTATFAFGNAGKGGAAGLDGVAKEQLALP